MGFLESLKLNLNFPKREVSHQMILQILQKTLVGVPNV